MTRIEYELLRDQEPQLKLPTYSMLRLVFGQPVLDRLAGMDRETLITNRVAVMGRAIL